MRAMFFGQFNPENLHPVVRRIKEIVFLEVDGDQTKVYQQIVPEIEIRGERFWFLLCSCIIASIGLNTNSAAVIIGAMLVSPLMGPLLGLGFGLAIQSRQTIMLAIRNLVWAVLGSLLLSSLYFLVTPLQEPTAEILARTAPTLLDLFVAVASAFAGVIALTARGSVSIIPGVAIATAIMPPLCSAGYGIATGDFRIALGATYLFMVNALAITLVTFFLFKRMKFHETDEELATKETVPWRVIATAIVIFLMPLGWTFHRLWKDSSTQQQLKALMKESRDELEVVNWRYESGDNPELVVYAFREAGSETLDKMNERLRKIEPKAKLVFKRSAESEETKSIIEKFKSSPLFPVLSDQSALVNLLEARAQREKTEMDKMDLLSMSKELTVLLESEMEASFFVSPKGTLEPKTLTVIRHKKRMKSAERSSVEQRVRQWFAVRAPKAAPLEIVWQAQDQAAASAVPLILEPIDVQTANGFRWRGPDDRLYVFEHGR